jgi:O-antigen/teichoic acid export membrane protein
LIYNIGPNVLVDNSYLLNDQGQISAKFIFVCNLLSNGVVILFLTKEFRDYSIRLFDIKLLKPILVYGLPLMASQLGGVVNESLDRSVYKHIVSDKETGLYDLAIYGANYKIAGFIMLVIQMFRYAAEPFFFNSSKEKDSKQQFSKLMNLFVGVIVTMSLFILVFIDYFKILIDEDYHEGLFIVPYIVLSYVLAGILFNLSVWFKLSGKTHYAIIITVVGALITLLINFVYVPEYKYLASAYAHVIAYSVMVLISFFLGQKFYRIKYDVWIILGYLGLGICLYKIDLLINFDNVLLNNLVKLILVGLFAIFVAWKENILQLIMSKKDES